MADKKKKVRSVKDTPRHKVGVVLGTGFFVILCAIIVFPVFAGLLASFRPGKELIRRGLSIDLDFSTMSLDNYTYFQATQTARSILCGIRTLLLSLLYRWCLRFSSVTL